MSFQKKRRVVDRKLLDAVAAMPCTVRACRASPSDPHHITTVKAGGDDVWYNVIALCRRHHTEWHAIGPGKMMEKYPEVHEWLVTMGRTDVIERSGR